MFTRPASRVYSFISLFHEIICSYSEQSANSDFDNISTDRNVVEMYLNDWSNISFYTSVMSHVCAAFVSRLPSCTPGPSKTLNMTVNNRPWPKTTSKTGSTISSIIPDCYSGAMSEQAKAISPPVLQMHWLTGKYPYVWSRWQMFWTIRRTT